MAHDAGAVPVIDIAPYRDGAPGERAAVVRQVGEALERIGFMTIAGHGVAPDLIDRLDRVTKQFFALPLADKLQAASPEKSRFQGYAAPGRGEGAQISERQSFNVQKFDTLEEAYAAGYPADCGTSIHPAMWPAHPAEFRTIWREYFTELGALARHLLAIAEEWFGLPPGFFAAHVDKDQSALVANYYSFDIDPGFEPSPYRFKAHTDDSCLLTILYQDDGPGGLQVHQRGVGWCDVAPVAGAYVVNIGEVLERWTNDRFVATPHRVLRPAATETRPRLSVPFFFKPNHDAVIAAPAELIAAGDTAHYAPITGREWAARTHRNDYDSPAAYARRVERDAVVR